VTQQDRTQVSPPFRNGRVHALPQFTFKEPQFSLPPLPQRSAPSGQLLIRLDPGDRPRALSRSMLNENELVTPEIARLRLYAGQLESAIMIEIEDVFRFGHFEGIPPDPIDHVPPQ